MTRAETLEIPAVSVLRAMGPLFANGAYTTNVRQLGSRASPGFREWTYGKSSGFADMLPPGANFLK